MGLRSQVLVNGGRSPAFVQSEVEGRGWQLIRREELRLIVLNQG